MILKAVECVSCGKLHKVEEYTYLSIHGDIYQGSPCGGDGGKKIVSAGAGEDFVTVCNDLKCLGVLCLLESDLDMDNLGDMKKVRIEESEEIEE